MRKTSVGMVRPNAIRLEIVDGSARKNAERGTGRWSCLSSVMILALLCACFAVGAKAQDVSSITGTVMDKTGGAVSDADVKLIDTRTGAAYASKTGTFGAYLFSRVPAGAGYTLTVSKAGFKTVSITNVSLAVT